MAQKTEIEGENNDPGEKRLLFGLTQGQTKNANVFLVGLSFLLLFTAFQTMGNVQTLIIDSARQNGTDGYVDGFNGDGFISLAIIYAVSAVFNWLAPSAMAVLGLKITMIVGAVTYSLFIASFFYLHDALLYSASGLIGVGAALIWTAQGAFLTLNSTPETMARNSGIFWAMLQCSLLIGNTFVYFVFQGEEHIDKDTRLLTVGALFGSSAAGVLCFFTLLPTPWVHKEDIEAKEGVVEALVNSFKLFATPEMIQLQPYFFYMGLELTFWSGVYGTCLGHTLEFDDAKSMAGLHGIMVGVGEIVGGGIFGIFGFVTNRIGRSPVVVLGTLLMFTSYILISLNIPHSAPQSEGGTHDTSVFGSPKVWVAIVCSLLIGFADACYNTQTLSLLGGVYQEKSRQAFAIFKFMQCVAAATSFFYSTEADLYIQLGLLWGMGLLGTLFFVKIDIQTRRKEKHRADIMLAADRAHGGKKGGVVLQGTAKNLD